MYFLYIVLIFSFILPLSPSLFTFPNYSPINTRIPFPKRRPALRIGVRLELRQVLKTTPRIRSFCSMLQLSSWRPCQDPAARVTPFLVCPRQYIRQRNPSTVARTSLPPLQSCKYTQRSRLEQRRFPSIREVGESAKKVCLFVHKRGKEREGLLYKQRDGQHYRSGKRGHDIRQRIKPDRESGTTHMNQQGKAASFLKLVVQTGISLLVNIQRSGRDVSVNLKSYLNISRSH